MLIAFFSCRGIIHKEFVPQGTIVDSHCYLGAMQRLYERMTRDVFDTNSWLLLRDSAPSYCALNAKRYLAKKAITATEHPP
jgi:hypothetical protein